MDETRKGFVLVIVAMSIFGFFGIFIRAMELSPQMILFFYQVFGAIGALFLALRFKMSFSIRGFVWLLLGLATVALLNDLFYFTAFKMTTVSNTVLVHYTAPIFVAILAPFLIREKLEKASIIALIFSFFGLILILYPSLSINTSFMGILFALGSGVMYALMLIAYKKILKNMDIYVVNFYRFIIGIVVLLPFFFIEAPVITGSMVFLLILFGLLFAIIATSLHFHGVKRIKAQHAGILGYMEPVAATTYAVFLLTEIPTLFTLMGGALILFGGYLVIRSKK